MATSYQCLKCNHSKFEEGEIRATGGFWSKLFNVQNRKFITISCEKCGYTELFNKSKSGTMENVLDFMTN